MKRKLLAMTLVLLMLCGCGAAPEQPQGQPDEPGISQPEPKPAVKPEPEQKPEVQPEPEVSPEPKPEGEALLFSQPAQDWDHLITADMVGTAGPGDGLRPRSLVFENVYESVGWQEYDGYHGSFSVYYPQLTRLKDRALQDQLNKAIRQRVELWKGMATSQEGMEALLAGEPQAEAMHLNFNIYGSASLVGSLLSVNLDMMEDAYFMPNEKFQAVHQEHWYIIIDLETKQIIQNPAQLLRDGASLDCLNKAAAEAVARLKEMSSENEMADWEEFKGLPANLCSFYFPLGSNSLTVGLEGGPLKGVPNLYLDLWDIACEMPALTRASGRYIHRADWEVPSEPMMLYNTNVKMKDVTFPLLFKSGPDVPERATGYGQRVESGLPQEIMDKINADLEALDDAIINGTNLPGGLVNFATSPDTWGTLGSYGSAVGGSLVVNYSLYMQMGEQYRCQYYARTYDLTTGEPLNGSQILNYEGKMEVQQNHAWIEEGILKSGNVYLYPNGGCCIYCNDDPQYRSFEFEPRCVDLDWMDVNYDR